MQLDITSTGYPELIAGLRTLATKFSDFRFIWPKMAAHFYEIEKQTFSSQGRSTRWAALSPGYAKYKAAKFPGKPILQATGALVTSLTSKTAGSIYRADQHSLELGTTEKTWHQATRPFVDLNDNDFDAFGKILAEGLQQVVVDAGFQTARIG
jgi:phage gpG-like protein